MLRRQMFAATLAGLAASTAHTRAGSPGGEADHRFPASVARQIGGKAVRMNLTGTALRTKYLFRVYSLASYVAEGVPVRGPEALAALDVPKQLHLVFERDVDGVTMARAFRESIGRSHPAPAFGAELAALERHFIANPVKHGDNVWLTHVPGIGLGVQVNRERARVIGGVAFAQAAWGTYLGPNHLGIAIKTGLTSRL